MAEATVLLYVRNMEIISIKQKYTDYLHSYDNRVSKNIDVEYVRPYLGVLLTVKGLKYFAPLTSSGKGKKLVKSPKPESTTFYPIANCKLGGINLNNMIPLVDGVYSKYTDVVKLSPAQQVFHEKQIRFLRKHESEIKKKAVKIYNWKIKGELYPNYDVVTCDFKKLEEAAIKYAASMKKTLQKDQNIAEELATKKGKSVEEVKKVLEHIHKNDIFAKKETQSNKQKTVVKTQEKNITKSIVKVKKKAPEQNCR